MSNLKLATALMIMSAERDTTGYTTNTIAEDEPPVTVESILAGIEAMKEWQRRTHAKPLEPVEVTQEQWDVLRAILPVRNDPYIFAVGVPIIIKD